MNYGDFLLSYYKGFLYKIVGQIELNPPDQFRMAMINAFLKFISLRDFLILYTPSAVCLLAFVCFPLYPKKVIYLSRRAFVYKKRRNHISPTYNEETPDTSASNPAQKQSIAA
ncbi:unnamed protein product, partial [Mesorhabditis belari]|uniref:Uncharacterized protein n=1 Tax=Mesorhabditis belari TaxID=2138241 RepID=A0AAF3J209_9BILA